MRIAMVALHYGAEYLAWALRSIEDAVDEVHVLYTDVPSYGHGSPGRCPESEEELAQEAKRFLRVPLVWHRGRWPNEGTHRDSIHAIAKALGARQVLVVDADEVWPRGQAREALELAQSRAEGTVHARFAHFWRSFRWVCFDGSMPVRILNLDGEGRRRPGAWYLSPQRQPILHFGYAQSLRTVRYKWTCHGHQAELRPDWLARFEAWRPGEGDVHPTCKEGFWNPGPTPPELEAELRAVLSDHPYWGAEIIS